ncbi:UDP-2,3-diacylglucosamine diphosphatase [Campylobacter sp. LR291e]|nr:MULTISPECIES: metallophosphoesterase [unclassified Campylobacter]KAA6227343.1 UDP-2,3-diacylglucosamine diphosphatase [Campylobacter sp. LR286c]KAA6227969.1 UDP-2,3-diacylglucosamine diphosphatase [Campylobacter sp. LR185c]KAA6228379.1 UDP-2,3-diacylglucosamine diphosphatase [Campylobacter sp. LR196d]KAA6229380.1 UDP-2,3-diacylglucosamine diphosphatase [Campylobacter sp. LR291e]KAA6231185.1 UDP-2,3-diacylglucosamine diphosphatase [Campylobacter sp. LR264d]
MGDIFDVLVGEIKASWEFAKPYINLLEELCDKMEIVYIEGNHDFNLSSLFKRVKIFSIKDQPIKAILHISKVKKEEIFLAHGDIFLNPFVQFILKQLRNHTLLSFLNIFNEFSKHIFFDKILIKQREKNLFYKIENFKNLAQKRYLKYGVSGIWVVEGHYHQNFILKEKEYKYFNLSTFAHKRSFFVVEYNQEIKFQEQKVSNV